MAVPRLLGMDGHLQHLLSVSLRAHQPCDTLLHLSLLLLSSTWTNVGVGWQALKRGEKGDDIGGGGGPFLSHSMPC